MLSEIWQEPEEPVGPGDTGDTLIWDIIILKQIEYGISTNSIQFTCFFSQVHILLQDETRVVIRTQFDYRKMTEEIQNASQGVIRVTSAIHHVGKIVFRLFPDNLTRQWRIFELQIQPEMFSCSRLPCSKRAFLSTRFLTGTSKNWVLVRHFHDVSCSSHKLILPSQSDNPRSKNWILVK